MQTNLAAPLRDTHEGREAEAILRKCVHCGFCNATCPTYRTLGDELDGPRGRIYLIKELLEGKPAGESTRLHLDRCLTCRACETTCPSGVKYSRLADIGRAAIEARAPRPLGERITRSVLAWMLPSTGRFRALVGAGRLVAPLLPRQLRAQLPAAPAPQGAWPAPRHARRVLMLRGCVQPVLSPRTNAAAARVLDRLGVSLVEEAASSCCGALRFHLGLQDDGLEDARAVIDSVWPRLESGECEAVVIAASGCGSMLREYGELLASDPAYAAKAKRVSASARDLSEIVSAEIERLPEASPGEKAPRVTFQAPCSLQHGQRVTGVVEELLARCGYACSVPEDAGQCCGSAGTYSLLQPALSLQIRAKKLDAIAATAPETIATANIGCQQHLQAGTAVPVRHWIELVDDALGQRPPASR